MGREEQRETLAGNRAEHTSEMDLDATSHGVQDPLDAQAATRTRCRPTSLKRPSTKLNWLKCDVR